MKSQGNRIGGEIEFWAAKVSGASQFQSVDTSWWALGFDAVGQIRIVPHVYIDFDVPFGFTHETTSVTFSNPGVAPTTQSASDTQAMLGNITVGAHYGANALPNFAWFVGGTLSIPTVLWTVDTAEELAALTYLGAARADYDLHRYAPEHFPVRAHGGIEWQMIPILYLRADLAPVVYIPLHSHQDTEFFTDQGNEFEVRAPMGVGGGLRIQETFFWTNDADRVQTAIEPFFSYEAPGGRGLYARVGLLVALDEQLGFGFDHGKVATLRGAVGGKF